MVASKQSAADYVFFPMKCAECWCHWQLRQQVEQALNMKLDEYRNYFDEELIRILGQMDAPSQILDFLYLGSEWNASNLEELQRLG